MAEQYCITTIDLLRHGQPEGGEIFRGSIDVPLNDEGWRQMRACVKKESGWQHIVSSPMSRCSKFTEELSAQKNIGFTLQPNLTEISFGDWDGLTFKAVEKDYAEQFKQYWQDPLVYTPPNAEPLPDFCERIHHAFWQEVANFKGRHLLMVVHGGVIRAILADILGSEPRFLMRYEVPYASLSRIKIYHEGDEAFAQLIFHNR